jgi:arylsulfatase A-like enzyme
MNAIAKLFEAHQYRRVMSENHISAELFGFPEGVTPLNRGVPEMSHTVCGTLDGLERDLAAHRDDPRPVFADARTLDLHIGNTRFAPVPAGEKYPGFFEPYAARVRRLDACLGRFTTFLHQAGLWDNSIVIVLSDHGDSLGEGMRWGHGYTVFPEVIRIPLLIHLPPALRARATTDVGRVAFTTDITPTLYALLGEPAEPPRLEAGSPLFSLGPEPLADRRHDAFLVASSYGAVYGLLRENGGRLYIADAVEGRDYLFDLAHAGDDVRIGITDAERLASRALIREQVADLAAWYGRQ